MAYPAQSRAQWLDFMKKVGAAVLQNVLRAEVNQQPTAAEQAQSEMLEKILKDALATPNKWALTCTH